MWKAGSSLALNCCIPMVWWQRMLICLPRLLRVNWLIRLWLQGRWIRKDDVRKLAISEAALKFYPDLKPGDYIPLKIKGREESWEVVGIFKFVGNEGILAYAPYEYISQISNLANRSYSFRVVTDQHDRAYQDMMAEKLDHFFRDRGIQSAKSRIRLVLA